MSIDEVSAEIRKIQEYHRRIPEMVKRLNVPYYRRGAMAIPAFKMKGGGNPETDGREMSV